MPVFWIGHVLANAAIHTNRSAVVLGSRNALESVVVLQTSPLAVLLNAAFALLAVYHLAYLGVMFGSQSPEERKLELQVCMFRCLP